MSRGRQYQQLIQRLEELGVEVWSVPGDQWAPLLDQLPMDNLTLVQAARDIQNRYTKAADDLT